MNTITYRKTKAGTWVAYGPAAAITTGATIEVTTKAGQTKFEVVESTGRPFTVNGVEMVYGYLEPKAAPQPQNRIVGGQHSVSAPQRGSACDECGRNGARHPVRDSSGIGGVCCDRCARLQPYERSFA